MFIFKGKSEDVPKEIVEEFLANVRKLCLIYGSQQKASAALGVSLTSVHRYFGGLALPKFQAYLKVMKLMAEKMEEAEKL